ncbi:MAG TPA: 1-phosphofructokinase [Bacillota bacterium]|nr:1-phosphofructokinase [Bacillota bacterium]
MICTVTLNTAVDRTIVLDRMEIGVTNRVRESRIDPGGKGTDVSRVIVELGGETKALGFVAGESGHYLHQVLTHTYLVQTDFIWLEKQQTRTNTIIVDLESNQQTMLNEAGPIVDEISLNLMREKIRVQAKHCQYVVFAGSLPKGIPVDFYKEMIREVREAGAHPILDTDGDPLRLGLEAVPYLIKPNQEEISRLLGREIKSRDEIVQAVKELHAQGIQYVLVSMGGDGMIATDGKECFHVRPPKIDLKSPVGCGDSVIGGFLVAHSAGQSFLDALKLGTAAGAATATMPGTQLCQRPDVERLLPGVTVETL